MVDVIDNDVVPMIGFIFKKTELFKFKYEIAQQFIEKSIGDKKGKKPKRGVIKFSVGKQ